MKHRILLATSLLLAASASTGIVAADNQDLVARQKFLNAALKKVSPALVSVQDGNGAGSGVVVSEDGIVLTASHVVETSRPGRSRLTVVFPDGNTYRADLLGMNRSADAAMLKIRDPNRSGGSFPHVKLGESSKLERGEWCFALGHPGGFKPERPAPVRLGRVLSVGHRTIVSDCAIVLGDSGGPLFDMEGNVIGIHSMITEVIVENRHVAIDVFRRDGDRMENRESWGRLRARDDGLVQTNFFGVMLRWRSFMPMVSNVVPGSPADRAGIKSGDRLLSIARQRFADPLGLNTLLLQIAENQTVDVEVERLGRTRSLRLTTEQKPSRAELRSRRNEPVRIGHEEAEELRNQLTALRKPGQFEKRTTEEMSRFRSVTHNAQGSVVSFRRSLGRTIAFGAIMSSDGYIMTKASELEDEVNPDCILPSGRRSKFRIVGVDRAFDLMLLKVQASGLQPVRWASRDSVQPGTIVVTTNQQGDPFLPGVISVAARKLESSKRGFLGVVMGPVSNGVGVGIKEVLDGGAAERGELKAGDVLLSVNDVTLRGAQHLAETISSFPPNSRITLRMQRGNTVKSVSVLLTPQFVTSEKDVLLDRYDRSNGFVSTHHTGFPEVLEHDTDLYPNHCGGPLYNISGDAIGLNIARAARITSYAIPASAVTRIYRELKAKDTGR